MRLSKRHAFAGLLLLLALAWWAAPDDVRVGRSERAPRVSASASPDRPIVAPRAKRPRPPLVIHPPSTDTAEADPTFEVSVWFETKSGEHLPYGYVVGCGFVGPRFLSNGSSLALADVPCTASGLVEDGFLVRRSAPAEVDPETADVTFLFPDERTGGIGIQIRADSRGIVIDGVLPGGPAEDLGLEPGDVVVAVEGKDAREISLDEFVETMTGPEGSDVEFVLLAGGDTGDEVLETVKVTRRFLGT